MTSNRTGFKSLITFLTGVQIFAAVQFSAIPAQAGPGKAGGGNTVSQNGNAITLDHYFAVNNKDMTPKTDFPKAYDYYQSLLTRVGNAIPSLAKKIDSHFIDLKWKLVENIAENKECLNNLGIYRLPKGSKQEILACQIAGDVFVDRKVLATLTNPEHLGEIFLHEAMVLWIAREMTAAAMEDTSNEVLTDKQSHKRWVQKYSQYENAMITEFTPYIIANQTLDPYDLYHRLAPMGVQNNRSSVAENGVFKFLIEIDSYMRADYERFKFLESETFNLEKKRDRVLMDYLKAYDRFNICDRNNPEFASRISFNQAVNSTHELLKNSTKLTRQTIQQYRQRALFYEKIDSVIQISFNERAKQIEKGFRDLNTAQLEKKLRDTYIPYCFQTLFGK